MYPCQRTSAGTHIYERIGAIHRRLGFVGGLFEMPPKPKHMRWGVYLELLKELFLLWEAPEMPLRRFWVKLEAGRADVPPL